jgi:hypothetical protein
MTIFPTPEKGQTRDPVFWDGKKWYFWNETWSDKIGPYDTEDIARTKLAEYCDELNGIKTFLCYWELHVDEMTFIVHTLVKAKTGDEALDKMEPRRGENYHLQVKGCLGEFTPDLAMKFMSVSNLQHARIAYIYRCPECDNIEEVKLFPDQIEKVAVPCTMCTGLNPPLTIPPPPMTREDAAPMPHCVLVCPKDEIELKISQGAIPKNLIPAGKLLVKKAKETIDKVVREAGIPPVWEKPNDKPEDPGEGPGDGTGS